MLIDASTGLKTFEGSSLMSSANCGILRNDLVRLEDACYDPLYDWYVSLVLIAIMATFAFVYFIFLCLGLGKSEEKP